MSEEIRYYKGKHKVRVLTKSPGNWIVEALEPFRDMVNSKEVNVATGEKRIVVPNLLFRRSDLAPAPKEHAYELGMEKKLRQLVGKERKKQGRTSRLK
jgi:hypothetical protein